MTRTEDTHPSFASSFSQKTSPPVFRQGNSVRMQSQRVLETPSLHFLSCSFVSFASIRLVRFPLSHRWSVSHVYASFAWIFQLQQCCPRLLLSHAASGNSRMKLRFLPLQQPLFFLTWQAQVDLLGAYLQPARPPSIGADKR